MAEKIDKCPVCGMEAKLRPGLTFITVVRCPRCTDYSLDLPYASQLLDLYADRMGLVSGSLREMSDSILLTKDSLERMVSLAPQTADKRALKLLAYAVANSGLGTQKTYTDDDFSAAYTLMSDDFQSYAEYLERRGFVEAFILSPQGISFSVTVEGHAHVAEGKTAQPRRIFISSTCYDLMDARFVIAEALEAQGHIVKLSDSDERFEIDQKTDALTTCLQNLEQCDLMIGIIDRRYGPILPKEFGSVSATHMEFKHAEKKKIPRSFFMRDRAALAYDVLVKDPKIGGARWNQIRKEEEMKLWLEMVKHYRYPKAGTPNWFATFSNATDLRKLVLKRVAEFKA